MTTITCTICGSKVRPGRVKQVRGYKKGSKFRERVRASDFAFEGRINCFQSTAEFEAEVNRSRTTWTLCADCYDLGMGCRSADRYHRLRPKPQGVFGGLIELCWLCVGALRRGLAAFVAGITAAVSCSLMANAIGLVVCLAFLLIWQIETWIGTRWITGDDVQPSRAFQVLVDLQVYVVSLASCSAVGGFFGGAAGSAVNLNRPVLVAFGMDLLSAVAVGGMVGVAQLVGQPADSQGFMSWITAIVTAVAILCGYVVLSVAPAMLGAKTANLLLWGRWPREI